MKTKYLSEEDVLDSIAVYLSVLREDVTTLESSLSKIGKGLLTVAALVERFKIMRDETEEGDILPWSKDLRSELSTNDNCPGLLKNGWWPRRLDQIVGVTFHHTLSNSPHATARYYVKKGGGRPTIPYTIWITETGEVLLCVSLEEGLWHDHTGHKNVHLSVGLAGGLHLSTPSLPQLDAAAKVAVWAIQSEDFSVGGADDVKGHMDFIQTACPGWNDRRSDFWKARLYGRISALIQGRLP